MADFSDDHKTENLPLMAIYGPDDENRLQKTMLAFDQHVCNRRRHHHNRRHLHRLRCFNRKTATAVVQNDIQQQSHEQEREQQLQQQEQEQQLTPLSGESITLIASSRSSRMQVVFGVIVRLVLPLLNSIARRWRGIWGPSILKTLSSVQASRQLWTSLYAFAANTVSMSLSSVQVVHRIDPLLKMMKLKKRPLANINEPTFTITSTSHEMPTEKCVTCQVLAEPPPGTPIRADIVLIHGLHGSLVNTWKQGLWSSEGRSVYFERPPRPPIRPPKRPRHSRTTFIEPPHLPKRARYLDHSTELHQRGYMYICDEPDSIEVAEDVDYSFPSFRFRLEEIESNERNLTTARTTAIEQKRLKAKKTEPYSRCWPGDWLPIDCPGVRVIALNYTTDPYLWRPVWVRKRNRTSLTERARAMTELLIEHGVGVGRPIVWVGHSKGGLFIKQIIIDAWERGRAAAVPLWRSSNGVFFYSVPHRGSPLADFNMPFLVRSIELIEIQKDCPSVLELHRRFVALYRGGILKIKVFSFVETKLTLMSMIYLRIVGIDSADPGIGEVCGLHLDHREICKPRNRNCILYTELVKMINNVC